MIGQDAVNVAETFNERLNLDGVILTKLDGDARGGAALSVKEITGKPIKFLGMGESLDKLEEFRPEGMASRILGMGDIVGLVKDFEQVVDEEKAEEDAIRMLKGKFDMQDFLEQIRLIQKMGSLKDLFEKLPFFGGGLPEGVNLDDRELTKIEAMISSMTREERTNPQVFVATTWEDFTATSGKSAKRRRADFDPSRRQAGVEGLGPQRAGGQGAAAEVRADAPDDGAARRVDRPDGQDPRLQAVLADEEAGEHGHQRADGRRRRPADRAWARARACPTCRRCRAIPTGNVPGLPKGYTPPGSKGAVGQVRASDKQKARDKRKAEKAARKKNRR